MVAMSAHIHEAQVESWVCECTGKTYTVVLYSDDEAKLIVTTPDGQTSQSYYDKESCMIPHIQNLMRLINRRKTR